MKHRIDKDFVKNVSHFKKYPRHVKLKYSLRKINILNVLNPNSTCQKAIEKDKNVLISKREELRVTLHDFYILLLVNLQWWKNNYIFLIN